MDNIQFDLQQPESVKVAKTIEHFPSEAAYVCTDIEDKVLESDLTQCQNAYVYFAEEPIQSENWSNSVFDTVKRMTFH